uniref:Uncharacterized protein n=1 Tax=Amphimedon queenslandica TaxID=400682 RepID=A0A1X7TX58_AMPQE
WVGSHFTKAFQPDINLYCIWPLNVALCVVATKPITLPDTYSGDCNWEQWILHYKACATVMAWSDDEKLIFLGYDSLAGLKQYFTGYLMGIRHCFQQ